jgi:hypothetical protein
VERCAIQDRRSATNTMKPTQGGVTNHQRFGEHKTLILSKATQLSYIVQADRSDHLRKRLLIAFKTEPCTKARRPFGYPKPEFNLSGARRCQLHPLRLLPVLVAVTLSLKNPRNISNQPQVIHAQTPQAICDRCRLARVQ